MGHEGGRVGARTTISQNPPMSATAPVSSMATVIYIRALSTAVRQLGICVIGLGRAGTIHAEIFRSGIEQARLMCVADQNKQVAKEAGVRLRVDWSTEPEDALQREDVDAAVIAVPTNLHAQLLLTAIRTRKHAMVEKPLTASLDEGKRMAAKARSSGLVVQVGYMRRFDKHYMEAREKAASGYLGKLILYRAIAHDPGPPPGWAADPRLSGGIFYDMLSHDFDMARHLMDSEVSAVHAVGASMLYEEVRRRGDYDVVSALLTFKSGAYGYVEGTRKSTYGYDLRTEVVGSEASVVVGGMGDALLTLADKGGVRRKGLHWFTERFREAFLEEDRRFVRSILNNSASEVPALDGLRAIEIAEACKVSVREGRQVELRELR